MNARLLLPIFLILLCANAVAQALAAKQAHPYDGRWAVVLTCPDTKDESGFVKGYEYKFSSIIDGGNFKGQFGIGGRPDSIAYTGSVFDDGTLTIKAIGNTGSPSYSAGTVASGTTYSYTLLGRLTGSTGQATRLETRPCTAAFTKN